MQNASPLSPRPPIKIRYFFLQGCRQPELSVLYVLCVGCWVVAKGQKDSVCHSNNNNKKSERKEEKKTSQK